MEEGSSALRENFEKLLNGLQRALSLQDLLVSSLLVLFDPQHLMLFQMILGFRGVLWLSLSVHTHTHPLCPGNEAMWYSSTKNLCHIPCLIG